MKSIIATCANCGKEVKKYHSQVAKSKAYYCSRACYYQAKSKGFSLPDQRGPKNPFWKGGVSSVLKVCKKCGKEFSSAKANEREYCSKECGYEDKQRRSVMTCLVCEKEFEVRTNQLDRRLSCLCSKKCSGEWYSANYTGENHHATGKHYGTEHRMKIRESNIRTKCGIDNVPPPSATQRDRKNMLFNEWRRAVVSHDDGRCVRCGEIDVKVHAHHIMPYSVYPELGIDKDNGITLCESCHKLVHSHDFLADIEGNATGCSIRGEYAAVY